MVRFSLFAAAATLIATGCGLKELTPAQEARFTGSLGNVGTSIAAIQTTGQRYGGRQSQDNAKANPLQRPEVRTLVASLCAGRTGGEHNEDVDEIVDRMEKSVSAGDCEIPMDFPTEGAGKDLKEVHFSIEGENCPLTLELSLKPTGKPNDLTAEFSLRYAVRDEAILQITDIDRMEMTGSMSVSTSGLDATTVDKDSIASGPFSSTVEMEMKGTIHSQKEGELTPYLKLYASNEMDPAVPSFSSETEMTLGMQFNDFTGELTMNVSASSSGQPSEEYALNGKEISKRKFQELMATAGLNKMSDQKQSSPLPEDEFSEDE